MQGSLLGISVKDNAGHAVQNFVEHESDGAV
jgi:hypothetical protein